MEEQKKAILLFMGVLGSSFEDDTNSKPLHHYTSAMIKGIAPDHTTSTLLCNRNQAHFVCFTHLGRNQAEHFVQQPRR